MYQVAQSIYYSLAIFVITAAFFVMQPTDSPQFASWQQGIQHQLIVASRQTIGDQPWFSDLVNVYESIAGFYDQASSATIALLTQPETDEDIIYVFGTMYSSIAKSFDSHTNTDSIASAKLTLPPENFMMEEPIYNIVPYRMVVKTVDSGEVAGASIDQPVIHPVNSSKQPWVTLVDNATGQLYCLALFNDTVNKYLGPCKYDDYQ